MTMNLYKVSESEENSADQQLQPKTKKEIQFKLRKSFKIAYESEGSYLYQLHPVFLFSTKAKKLSESKVNFLNRKISLLSPNLS